MKKFILAFALLIGIVSFSNNTVSAQSLNISINIGRQPAWGPIGYDYAGYYYFPEINCYYDVNVGMFYYVDRGYWVSARYLPYSYRNYDLYRLYKVVLDVRNPWRYNHTHYRDYGRYRGYNHRQVIIRDSRDYRYNDSRRNRIGWYSSNKYTVNRHNERYTYNRNENARPNYNNNKNSQTSRPNYNRNQNQTTRDNKEYNRGQSGRTQNTRPSVSSRENNSRDSKQQTVQRNSGRNDNTNSSMRSSRRSSDTRLVSNSRTERGR